VSDVTEESRPCIRFERDGDIAIVTLDRPQRRNALNAELMDSLRRLWADQQALDGVRCSVLTGAGPGFCAGADVELLHSDRRETAAATAADELSFLPGGALPMPVIVAVNGVCAGGGLHFVADADIVVAAAGASFLDPHVSVGQITALEPITLLPTTRGDVLMRMVLLGRHERLSAQQALAAGLVSEVVPDDALMERARELARLVASNSPAAVQESRRLLRQAAHAREAELLERGWQAIRAHWEHPDAREGPAAFLERREPVWSA
jgi:enoyl-CoA hydratase/carnithine racemase